ncbi:MAG: hypothetical protein ACHP7O_12395 [Burkholderiales bacterium]
MMLRARRRLVSSLVEPHSTLVQQKKRQKGFDTINQQASFLIRNKSLPDLSLQSKHSSSTFLRVIRLQQRCNLDSRRDDAYTSFVDAANNAAQSDSSFAMLAPD